MSDTTIGDWRFTRLGPALVAALLGPLAITIFYLVVASLLRDLTGATGYARASLDLTTYAAYVVVLALFVIVGTLKCRGDTLRVLFALAAIVACLFDMFVAFFSQMAP